MGIPLHASIFSISGVVKYMTFMDPVSDKIQESAMNVDVQLAHPWFTIAPYHTMHHSKTITNM